jgi:hypothetical protein
VNVQPNGRVPVSKSSNPSSTLVQISGVGVTVGVGVALGIGVTEGVGVTGVGVTLGVGVDGRRLTKTFISALGAPYAVILQKRNNTHKAKRIMTFNGFVIFICPLSDIPNTRSLIMCLKLNSYKPWKPLFGLYQE